LGQIIGGDAVQPRRLEPMPQMAIHDASVLPLGRVAKVEHRPVEPLIGGFAKVQLRVGNRALPASPPR
jgi:hypothetical protein